MAGFLCRSGSRPLKDRELISPPRCLSSKPEKGRFEREPLMATSLTSSNVGSRLMAAAPAAGLLLVVVGLVVLAVGPLGWRAGWWHYRVAFTWMLPYGAY